MTTRRFRLSFALCAPWLTALAIHSAVIAQTPPPAVDPNVSPASLNRTAPLPAAKSIRFARRPSQVGDQVDQIISREMRLTTVQRQGDKVLESSTRTMRGRQERCVTTTRIDSGRAQAVTVRYGEATKRIETAPTATSNMPPDAQPPAAEPMITSEAVAGKTYRCWREGEKLIVTDDQGRTPSPAEVEIVAADMEPVGLPNPFAEFLVGRTIDVGETVNVPVALADRLLALDNRFGKVTQFTLTLREVRADSGTKSAVFQASIEAASMGKLQMRLIVDGTLAVEVDTCRTLSSNLTGPLAMSESRGSYSTAYQIVSTGKLSTIIASTFRDAK